MSPLGSVYFNLSTSVYFFSIKIDLSYNLFSDFIENKKQQKQIHSKHFGLESAPQSTAATQHQTPDVKNLRARSANGKMTFALKGGGSKVPLRLLKNGLKIHLISLPDCQKRVLHIDEL